MASKKTTLLKGKIVRKENAKSFVGTSVITGWDFVDYEKREHIQGNKLLKNRHKDTLEHTH